MKIYNTASKTKEEFIPLDKNNISIYCCGPTVYNYAHIGNARAALTADLFYRLISEIYGSKNVTYARNITDIDDKIILSSKETGQSIENITTKYTKQYRKDMESIGILKPDFEPKVSNNVHNIISMISTLIEKGHAYEVDGDVFFSVSSYKDYSFLFRERVNAENLSSRIQNNTKKKDPRDFALWKSSEEIGSIDSPWGLGRMGWHIECSSMIESIFGKTIDLHLGGRDLIFPHHENECAQSKCANGRELSNYWAHNGYLKMQDGIMSKSKGNVQLISSILKKYNGMVIRLALMSSHYRQDMVWTTSLLEQSRIKLDYMLRAIEDFSPDKNYSLALPDSILDDMNTPLYISEMMVVAKEINSGDKSKRNRLYSMLKLVGIQESRNIDEENQDIDSLIQKRDVLKSQNKWEESDIIREQIRSMGYEVSDVEGKTKVRRII
jgi:cysteinyl-tRNA synthetase